jgi:hypothetical protein
VIEPARIDRGKLPNERRDGHVRQRGRVPQQEGTIFETRIQRRQHQLDGLVASGLHRALGMARCVFVAVEPA